MKVSYYTKSLMLLLAFAFLGGSALFASTGKIAGQVVDKASGEPLPGVNVVIDGTQMGAATDGDGTFFIINVPPGNYSVRASIIGYAAVIVTDVDVSVNLTTTVNFTGDLALSAETVEGQEVTVVAIKPVVQPDVSANIANITAGEIENLPIAGVSEAIDLQAGVEPGMTVRGGGLDQVNFVVDGVSMRDSRDNKAFTSVSYTAIEEFQLQTGGFNAEYGNIRSGLVNVVTKEPSRDAFHVDAFVRYRPDPNYHFDEGPRSPNAYWQRPYIDADVANVGTANGPWDQYTQRQYPPFDGWNTVVENALADEDPSNDLTVAQYQQVFDYHHRKNVEVSIPEYTYDLTLTGPLGPGFNSNLGDLRFLLSYRGTQEPYFYPQAREAFTEDYVQGKVISDLSKTMKLTFNGMYSKQQGMAFEAFRTVLNPNPQRGGIPIYPWGDIGTDIGNPALDAPASMVNDNDEHVGRSVIYGTDRYSVTDVTRQMFGANFTHSLNTKTFYEASIHRMETKYRSNPDRRRDLSVVENIGPLGLDEAPFGWTSQGTSSPGSGLRLGGHWARARDTSNVVTTTAKFDLTSQVNRFTQLKTGVELIFDDYDMRYGSDDSVIVHLERSRQQWTRTPFLGAAYAQTKLEFQGMIANLGLRMDYYSPGGQWFSYDEYDRIWSAASADGRNDVIEMNSVDNQVALSPRVGISFPVTANSKFFFNYGHFRQVLDSRQLYQVELQWLGNLGRIGNPNQPFTRTVAYELGYEQNVFDQYLLRLSGYYRDNENQPRQIQFINIDNEVNYELSAPYNYQDIRGFEITLNKNRGNWFRGFVNYTFMQFKSGNFGFGENYESVVSQREYELTSTDHYQNKPVSQPFGNFNLEFITPDGFGPEIGGGHPLADFRIDLLGGYRSGTVFTWTGPAGGDIPGLQSNIRMNDFFNLDLRFSKNLGTTFGRAQVYLDVNNLLGLRHMFFDPNNAYGGPFEGNQDWEDYMRSLHISDEVFEDIEEDDVPYLYIPGNDRPGAYRDADVAFVPIEIAANNAGLPSEGPGYLEPGRRVLYYVHESGSYMEYVNGGWQQADNGFVNQVLDDKAYIDMPNETDRTFLNPRSIRLGLRVSF